MEHELQIELRDKEGAVLRAIGMVERRGFRMQTCHVEKPSGDSQQMRMTVRSARSIGVLQRQLERLHDVISVQRRTPAAPVKTVQQTARGTAK